jgi:hypothetical protein
LITFYSVGSLSYAKCSGTSVKGFGHAILAILYRDFN